MSQIGTNDRNDGNSVEEKIPSDVRNALTELKAYFADSIEHCEQVLNGKDFDAELDYLLRDHAFEPHNRNLEIAGHIKTLREFQNVLEGYNKEGN